MLLGSLPLFALAADQEGAAADPGRGNPVAPPAANYVAAQAEVAVSVSAPPAAPMLTAGSLSTAAPTPAAVSQPAAEAPLLASSTRAAEPMPAATLVSDEGGTAAIPAVRIEAADGAASWASAAAAPVASPEAADLADAGAAANRQAGATGVSSVLSSFGAGAHVAVAAATAAATAESSPGSSASPASLAAVAPAAVEAIPAVAAPPAVTDSLARPASGPAAAAPVPVLDPAPLAPAASGGGATIAPESPAGEPLALKVEQTLAPDRPVEEQIPVFVQGLKISGQTGVQTVVEGDAELRKRGSQIKAQTITYWPVEDEMLARDQVRALKNGDLFTGTELRLKLDVQTGYFLDVNYLMAGEKARGEALRMDFLGQDAYHAEDATYTTCGPGNDDWFLKVGKLDLDFGRDVGEAENAQIIFLGHKILQLPSMSFTLNDRRKSGFLAPSFGSSVNSGQEFSIPYYWNIAPNRDMTVTERVMSKRGLQSSAAFRYLGETYKGQMSGEILPNDSLTKTTRSGFSILHTQTLYPGLTGNLNLNKVSDNAYFTDLSARLALTAQTYLTREGSLNYARDGYNFGIRAQAYQTLQDPLSPVAVPYFRLPQLSFSTTRYDVHGFDLGMISDFTRFSHATQVMGNRTIVNPSISYPLITPGFYVTPKVSLNSTRYHLENLAAWQTGYNLPANAQTDITRNLPVVSVDSGMTFEKPTRFMGNDYTQTLEPRVYYLRVPYRDQSNIPIFDTGAADFNFSQIFSENIYSGGDRIADANQVTAAVSTRLLNTSDGGERMRASIGQRYYFATQRVTLPSETARTDRTSDFLASISGELLTHLHLDSAVQYNPSQKQIQRVSHGVRWTPEPGNTVSAAYRYQRDLLEQVDFAAQWRVAPRWYGVGRYNYSIRDGRVVEALGGFEYDGDCWVGRVVVQRYALATQKASTSIFFQIELNGLSRLGSNPLDVLRRNIPGYTKLNDNQVTQPRSFNNYE